MQLSRESLRCAEDSRPHQGGNEVLSKDWNWACEDGSHESDELLRTGFSTKAEKSSTGSPAVVFFESHLTHVRISRFLKMSANTPVYGFKP